LTLSQKEREVLSYCEVKMKYFSNQRMISMFCVAAGIVVFHIIAPGITTAKAQEIRTPAPPPTPRVNGPSVFGVRPSSPVLYKIPATGDGTLTYSVDNLPAGLSLNSSTGEITGTLTTAGDYAMTLRTTNSLGSNTKQFQIKVGDTINLTPAMGWNSWNAYGTTVSASLIQTAANAMVSSGLINHGWSYINIDDGWQGTRGGTYNAIQGNSKFPDMQGLVNTIHGLNLKAGIYSSPWVTTYGGNIGESTGGSGGHTIGTTLYETNDVNQWTAWGFDYLKYDWYINLPPETQRMHDALNASTRDITLSLSNTAPFAKTSQLSQLANSWRISCDITDNWTSLRNCGFGQDSWAKYSGPGHFNDPDMLVVGYVGWGGSQHYTNLTYDEQYTHITLWSLLSAPLILGCDLTKLDAFTLNLLTNDEVLAVDQDALGKQATCVSKVGNLLVYEKDLENGSKAVGLFNLGDSAATVTANWDDLNITGGQYVRDIWRQVDKGHYYNQYSMTVSSHGAELIEITPNPEPATLVLLGSGAFAVLVFRVRQRYRQQFRSAAAR
ncbi:MAG: putative Ig domain-containing protein, partial [Thermoguttaceae bacterium]